MSGHMEKMRRHGRKPIKARRTTKARAGNQAGAIDGDAGHDYEHDADRLERNSIVYFSI